MGIYQVPKEKNKSTETPIFLEFLCLLQLNLQHIVVKPKFEQNMSIYS